MAVSDLRVCHIATMTRWGGVERMLADLLIYSIGRPVRHYLLTTSSVPEVLQPIRDAGATLFEPARRGRYDPRAIGRMARWLRRNHVQVVHTYNGYANSWGMMAARLAGIPATVAGEHGTVWRMSGWMGWLDRWAQRQAKCVVANSEASRHMLMRRYGVAPERIRVVPNAVAPLPLADARAVRAEFGLGDAPVIGSIGRLDTDKGYATFIEAAHLVLAAAPETRFLLIGGGPLESSLRRQVEAAGIADRFILTGWRSDARAIVQVFDLFVSTSIREPFGNVVIEAALAGVPAIVPAVDGLPEAVVDGETGLLLTPTRPVVGPAEPGASSIVAETFVNGVLSAPLSLDPGALAATIRALLDDAERRRRLGNCAQERARRLFTIERYVANLEAIYQETAQDAFDRRSRA